MNRQLEKVRIEMKEAKKELLYDKMNTQTIERTKKCTEEVMEWNSVKEHVLMQKSKGDWIKLRDGSNAYFHASLKKHHM